MEIGSWLLDKLISIIPGLILRVLYPPAKVAKQIKIDLKGETPINPSLGSSVPRIDIYFEITNLSNLDLTLDRLLIDLWFGQPTLVGSFLKRTLISSRSSGERVFFRSTLSAKQVSEIEPYLKETPPVPGITLYFTAYFVTKVGIVKVEDRIERRKI